MTWTRAPHIDDGIVLEKKDPAPAGRTCPESYTEGIQNTRQVVPPPLQAE